MEFLFEHATILTGHYYVALINVYLGLFGLALGDYWRLKKQGKNVHLWRGYNEKKHDVWLIWLNGEASALMTVLFFMHAGFLFLFLVIIGPSEDKWVDPAVKIS